MLPRLALLVVCLAIAGLWGCGGGSGGGTGAPGDMTALNQAAGDRLKKLAEACTALGLKATVDEMSLTVKASAKAPGQELTEFAATAPPDPANATKHFDRLQADQNEVKHIAWIVPDDVTLDGGKATIRSYTNGYLSVGDKTYPKGEAKALALCQGVNIQVTHSKVGTTTEADFNLLSGGKHPADVALSKECHDRVLTVLQKAAAALK